MSDVEVYRRKAIEYSEKANEALSARKRAHYARMALSSLAIAKNAEWQKDIETFIAEMRQR